jgi:hypothetical protein
MVGRVTLTHPARVRVLLPQPFMNTARKDRSLNSIVVYEATPDSGLSLAERMGGAVAQQPTPEFLASICKPQILLSDHTPFFENEVYHPWLKHWREADVHSFSFVLAEERSIDGYEDNPFYVRK